MQGVTSEQDQGSRPEKGKVAFTDVTATPIGGGNPDSVRDAQGVKDADSSHHRQCGRHDLPLALAGMPVLG